LAEGSFKSSDELTAKYAPKHLDGKEEGVVRGDPAGVVWSEPAGSKYAVEVRMKLQPLIPAVKHAEEADLSSKMPWIMGDLKQGLSTGMKEQVVNQTFVLQCERGQFSRQGEDGMDIASGQKFPFTRQKPAQARMALASWTVPVSARVIRDGGGISAVGTTIAMSTQRGGAAA
jgi:hypothetical protein